MLYSNCKPFNK